MREPGATRVSQGRAKMQHCAANAWNRNQFFTVLAQIPVPRGRQETMRLAAFVVLTLLGSSTVVSSTDRAPARAIARAVESQSSQGHPVRLLMLVTRNQATLGGVALVQ